LIKIKETKFCPLLAISISCTITALHIPYFKYLSSHSSINLFISLVLIGSVGICPAPGKTINVDSVPMSWSILK